MSALARWRRALAYLRPWRGSVAGILAATLIVGGLSAAEPLLFKSIFDAVSDGPDGRRFAVVLGGLAALTVVREVISGLSTWLTWRTRIGVNFELLDDTVGRLHALPLAFHKGERVGGLMTRVERGIQGFVDALSETAFQILPSLVYLAVALTVMVQLDLRLTAVVLAMSPVPVLIGVWAAREQVTRERALLDRWMRIYARFHEALAGIHTVKSFGMEDEERARFLSEVDEANRLVVHGVRRDTATGVSKNVAVALARLAALGLGGVLVLRGETTVGTVVAFLTYAGSLFGPIQTLTATYQTLRKATVALDAVFGILDARLVPEDAPDAVDMPRPRGDVDLAGLWFSYGEAPVLRGVDLHLRAGERVALVGPSGSGKSTVAALLQRLYDPDAGAVRIDGVDVRAYRQRSLRRHIGVVLQDNLLFDDTVRANIAYGRRDATDEEIVAAAKAANAHAFIQALPQGYDTPVGERGGLLSGGQRQRIAIARALLKDPPILILDEATSALDAESEAAVQEALDRLLAGRTTLVVAHRLSTVVDADRIVVLKDGVIEDEGTHAELVRRGGYYARLVRLQQRGLDLRRAG